MSVPINVRIKVVLLMAKFESPVVVRRKLQVEFGKNTPTEACILWGYLKNIIYKTPIKDLTELRTRINNEIRSISKKLCDVLMNIVKRMHLCIESDGDHFEHLL